MGLIKNMANCIAKTKFASKAISDSVELNAFKEKLTAKNYIGIFLMAFSYLLGLPAISLLGILSARLGKPLIIIIGGPTSFIIAHIVFFAGVYLAGGKYLMVFARWATRVILKKLM